MGSRGGKKEREKKKICLLVFLLFEHNTVV